jgi:hypothetical protein
MTGLLLHIGSPKAGSSAIQASLAGCSDQLRASTGLLVLPPNPYRRPMPSGFLAACYLPPEQLPRYLASRYRRDSAQFLQDIGCYRQLLADLLRLGGRSHAEPWRARLQYLKAHLLGRAAQPALLSSEFLLRLPSPKIKELREWFTSLGVRRFRILVYVRDPVSAYGSFLQQWLRLSDELQPYNPWTWNYQIRHYLEAWQSVFTPDEIVVRPFDRDQLVGGSVVPDFYDQCSNWFEMPIGGPEVKEVNQALSIEALMLVQELLKAVPKSRRLESAWMSDMAKFTRLLRTQTNGLPCSPVRLKPSVRRLVREQHTGDLEWLEQHYGIALGSMADADGAEPLPDWREVSRLDDLLELPEDPELIDQLRRRQLEAVVREGLQ